MFYTASQTEGSHCQRKFQPPHDVYRLHWMC